MRNPVCGSIFGATALALLAITSPATAQSANASPDKAAVLILDASGSMWGQLEGGITKIEVARDVMGQFFSTRDATTPLGVIAYGHNRRGDCADIEVIAQTGVQDPAALSQRLNRINPRGMTPISESLRLAASQIPPTAEEADIILVTDGLETCDADPCAVAAQLANEGIKIRAHVVGFGLTEQEAEALACVPDQTGGQLLRPQSGAELTDALNQIAEAEPAPETEAEPEPVQEAFFDIGPKAEAGHTYRIGYQGTAQNSDFAGFTRRGEGKPPSSGSFGPIGGGSVANNPFSKRAPAEPGEYDLILFKNNGEGIVARQPIEVVAASNGFDPIGSVEPGSRVDVPFRGPEQVGERITVARPDQPVDDFRSYSWAFALHTNGTIRVQVPDEPGEYELRYLNSAANEIMFSRRFGVGIPFEDADLTTSDDLAAQAAAATQAEPGQDALPMVPATFRIPDGFPETPLWWSAVPRDADMSPEAWAPQEESWIAEGEFEPGRYEVSAMGPGEVEFRAEVEIVPGQANDFVIPVASGGDEEAAADTLTGPWEVYGVPPWEVEAGLDLLLSFDLVQRSATEPVTGSWTATSRLGGAMVDGRTGTIESGSIDGNDLLQLRFDVGAPIADPFSLMVRPDGIGYSGGLSAGAMGIRVLLWPKGYELPPLDDLRGGLHGPDPRGGGQSPQPEQRGEAPSGPVPVRLITPFEIGGKRVQWSAVRTDTPVSDLAFAFNELEHMLLIDLEPGTYAVEGVNADEGIFLADTITVTAGGENSFEIPVAGAGDRGAVEDDHGDDVAFVCANTPAGCPVNHAESGISLTLPNNWTMSEPFFYETAGGARADVPTATFFSEEFGDLVTVELNPRQWLDSNGTCRPIGASQLCNYNGQGLNGNMGFELIHASLKIASSDGRVASGDNPLEGSPADTVSDPAAAAAAELIAGALGMGGGAQTPGELPPAPAGAIRLVLKPVEQFGSACFVNGEVSNPSGQSFTLFAPIDATANGQKVLPVINPEVPAVLEISAYTETGASLVPVMLMSPCDQMVVTIGPVQCRMGVGDGGPLTACPMPVEAMALPEFTDLAIVGAINSDLPSAPATPGSNAATGDIIPIDLGGRDPQQVLRSLFTQR
ncbi:MAG: VWA domain-containing protein [Mesorhizobium sp.]|nr:VWA domain-containing protein [Mesorhizobium sp.]